MSPRGFLWGILCPKAVLFAKLLVVVSQLDALKAEQFLLEALNGRRLKLGDTHTH